MEKEQLTIRRHRLAGLDVCDVTTDELDVIEHEGKNVGLDFQISEFCLTMALSFLATLLTVKIDSSKVYIVFVVIVTVGFIVGLAFGLKWLQSRASFSKSIQKIRDRQVGPMGDEKQVLGPKDLEALPLGPTGPSGPFAPPEPLPPPAPPATIASPVPVIARPDQPVSEKK